MIYPFKRLVKGASTPKQRKKQIWAGRIFQFFFAIHFDLYESIPMCNLRVIQDSDMVTSTSTPPQRLGYHKCSPVTPSQSPRGNKSGQFNKSPSPTGFAKGKQGKGKGYPATPTPKKVSVTRCHLSPMLMPHHGLSCSPHGRGSPQRFGSPQLSSSFAASKCFEPPTPGSLPKPPTGWFNSDAPDFRHQGSLAEADICTHLKLLLKVEA